MGSEFKIYDKQLVLVGGGHSHALLMRILKKEPIPRVKSILVSDTYHVPYSGMLPGYLSGVFQYDEAHIDLYKLCSWADVEFVHARVEGIDPKGKRIFLKDRPSISYDVLSIDIGSTPKMDDVPGAAAFAVGVKPVPKFLNVFNSMIKKMENGEVAKQSVVIVGGGAAGVEVALGLRQRIAPEHEIHLVHKHQEVLSDRPARDRETFGKILVRSRVQLHLGSPVLRVDPGVLHLKDGILNYHFLFWMTQASAAPWLRTSGLELDDRGFVLVRDTLQTTCFDDIFACGDVAAVKNNPRPKAGVFAVRQAKPLAQNLRRFLGGAPPKPFRPQSAFLVIVGTGDGRAVAMKGSLSVSGSWVWRWKTSIDRKFMRQFEDLPTKNLLEQNQSQNDASLVSGHRGLQYTEFFSAFVKDPFLLGNIAVNHCANEILAKGGHIISAKFDIQSPSYGGTVAKSQQSLLLAGLRLGLEPFGASLDRGNESVGGELGVKLTISGNQPTHGEMQEVNMAIGEVVILTKALGTGLILNAAQQLKARGRWVERAIESMLKPGFHAFAIAKDYNASMFIHVARLGLAGHLAEMLQDGSHRGREVTLRLLHKAIPRLKGVSDCLNQGIENRQAGKNSDYVRKHVTVLPSKKSMELFPLLFDPQIAGGLLFTVKQEHSAAVLAALHAKGDTEAAVIGFVEQRQDAQIYIE